MKGRRNNGSKLFLTELMLSIFFFAVIAAVCTEIFSEARLMSRQSQALAGGVNAAANVAEYFQSWDGSQSSWETTFPDGVWAEHEVWYQAYDENWQPVDRAGAYVVIMRLGESDGLAEAQITVQEYGEEVTTSIYELEVVRGAI